MYLKQAIKGVGGGSENMTEVLRPKTSIPTTEKKIAYNTNLNLHLKANPQQFYPNKISNVNPQSTAYNFINFSPSKQTNQLIHMKPGQKSSKETSSNSISYAISSHAQ